MAVLSVEVDDFVDAARWMSGQVAEPLLDAVSRLSGELASCGGMAGSDPGGASWAAAYDDATRSVFGAQQTVLAAAFRTSQLFGQSARNYARAEAASTAGGRGGTELTGLPVPATVGTRPVLPPGAAGTGGDGPAGWWLVEHTVGYVWPDGHQDLLRRAGSAWLACSEEFEAAASHAAVTATSFAADRLPEGDAVIAVCRRLSDRLADLAHHQRRLGDACLQLAHHLDVCHSAVLAAVQELLVESVAIQVLGAVTGVLTLGLAEAPAQAAQAGRVAAASARIGELVRRFLAAARVVGEALPTVASAGQYIHQSLERLAGARLVYAGMATARDLPSASRALSAGAAVHAGAGVAKVGTDATRDLPGAQALLPHLDDPKLFDPQVLRGMDPADIERAIPASWTRTPTARGEGQRFVDPANAGRQIRVMPGYPAGSRPDPLTWRPYAVVTQNGRKTKIDLKGDE